MLLPRTALQKGRKRRVATPRCPDCRSFLHECTCDGYLDVAAMSVAGVSSSRTESSKPPASAPLHSKDVRSLKRPRSAMDSGLERPQEHLPRIGGICTGLSEDRFSVARLEESVEGGSDVRDGNAEKDDQWNMSMEKNDEMGGYGGGSGGDGCDVRIPALIDEHGNDSRQLGVEKVLTDDLQRREITRTDNAADQKKNTLNNENAGNGERNEGGGERGCLQELTPNEVESDRRPGSCKENTGLTRERMQLEGESNGDDEEELWTQRKQSDVDFPTEENQKGDMKAESRVGPELRSAHGSGDKEPISEEGGDLISVQWQPRKGDLVEVERRTSPGLNKLGGTARVVKVDSRTGAVDVRYVVEGGWERGIDPVYVRPAVLDMTQKRPTLGRCSHCGSLRVDCAGRCEDFTRRSSRRLVPPRTSTALLGSEAGTESVAGDQRPKGNHLRDSQGSYVDDIELTKRNKKRIPRRRRYLQDNWDEEGDLVPRSDESGHIGVGRNETDRWMEGDSDGSLEDDDLAMGSQQRRPSRQLRKPGDDVDISTDGEIKLLSVARDRRGSLREGSVGNGSDGSGIGSSDSTCEEVSDGGDFGSSSKRGGVECHGWRESPAHAAEGSAVARFLMPEGEEAAGMLPSDIADPTRGIKDPARLRRELKSMLREMEERDANELEQEISKTCR